MDNKEKIVYQIWPRSFYDTDGDGIGDLNGVTEKLDYIKSLGVDLIWLSPVYASPNADYGYDISDYYAINPEFGTMEDFDRLNAEARSRGMGIIMDLVVNHTSDQCEWFKRALAGEEKYRDFYYFRKPKKDGGAPNNWMGFFGGSAWSFDEGSGDYYLTTFTPNQCDLNWENPEVRSAVYDVMRFWLDKGIAGFRMDVINTVKKAPGLPDKDPQKKGIQFPAELITDYPGVHDFIKEMNREVLSRYPDVFTVGEGALTGTQSVINYTNPDNHELLMMFQFDLHMLGCGPLGKYDFRKLYRWSIRDFKRVIDEWQTQMQKGGGWIGNYLSNHDQQRQVSRFGDDSEPYRRACARALCLLNLTLRGTPFIYQGEECGMTDCPLEKDDWKDCEALNCYNVLQSMMHLPAFVAEKIVKRVTRDHARTPVQWNNKENAGFSSGTPWMKVNPNYTYINIECESDHSGLVDFYRRAIAFRKSEPVLTWGGFSMLNMSDPNIIAYIRAQGERRLLVVINLTSKPHKANIIGHNGAKCLFTTHVARSFSDDTVLEPWEGGVYEI